MLLFTVVLSACTQKSDEVTMGEQTETVVTESIYTESSQLDASMEEEQSEIIEREQADIFIEEQILIDENDVKMIATSIEMTAKGDCYLNLQMENKTDQDLTFVMDEPFVNSCYTGNSYYEEVRAGECKKGSYLFLSNDF